MPVYLVTPLADNFDALGEAALEKLPQSDVYEVQGNAGWLVSFRGTSVELSHLIGITSADKNAPASKLGPAMVTGIGSYYGRASTGMWEWLRTRFEY